MQTIIVGYDGTRQAERALGRAADIAGAFGGRVVVAWVAPPTFGAGLPPDAAAFGLSPVTAWPDPALEEAEDEVWRRHREHVTALLEARGVPFEVERSLGRPDDELVALADELRADLIVVGTREPGFVDRLLGGSVSQGVARHAHCDVLIVHTPEPGD